MKHGTIIDLTDYFVRAQEEPNNEPCSKVVLKVLHYAGRTLDIAATAAITLCVCACTLLFFTML